MRAVWLGQVTVGLIGIIASACAPSAIMRRNVGMGSRGSWRARAGKPSIVTNTTIGPVFAALPSFCAGADREVNRRRMEPRRETARRLTIMYLRLLCDTAQWKRQKRKGDRKLRSPGGAISSGSSQETSRSYRETPH